MSSHRHLGGAHMTQNQGNVIGDKPCVRQSRLYREHTGGNTMKDLMGQGGLKWDVTKTEGAYAGGTAHDPLADVKPNRQPAQQQPQQQQQQYQPAPFDQPQQRKPIQQQQQQPAPEQNFARGRGNGNRSSAGYNILTHE